VVAGGQPLSVEAGMRILQRGGNAVDEKQRRGRVAKIPDSRRLPTKYCVYPIGAHREYGPCLRAGF
jgi:hypothetical protein